MQDYRQYITSNPNILFGKPAIKVTRIAVEQILDELAGGTTIEQLLEEFAESGRDVHFPTFKKQHRNSRVFGQAIAAFAETYADQTERDHATLVAYIKATQTPALS
jgi:hypothetical protein